MEQEHCRPICYQPRRIFEREACAYIHASLRPEPIIFDFGTSSSAAFASVLFTSSLGWIRTVCESLPRSVESSSPSDSAGKMQSTYVSAVCVPNCHNVRHTVAIKVVQPHRLA